MKVISKDSLIHFEGKISLGKKIKLWDEFHPNLYTLSCKVSSDPEGARFEHEKRQHLACVK